jgi:hypothetical protein
VSSDVDDVVLAYPSPIRPVQHVRSTLVLGGLQSIEAGGLIERYRAVAPAELQATIHGAVAGMWLPVATAVAHYVACDQMGVSAETAAQLGRGTFERTKGLLLGTATGLARGAGVTPWTLIPHLQRFWLRGIDGGGIRVLRKGPKEARIDVVGCPLLEARYFRAGLRGLATSLFGLTARTVYVHEQALGDSDTSISLRLQWV